MSNWQSVGQVPSPEISGLKQFTKSDLIWGVSFLLSQKRDPSTVLSFLWQEYLEWGELFRVTTAKYRSEERLLSQFETQAKAYVEARWFGGSR